MYTVLGSLELGWDENALVYLLPFQGPIQPFTDWLMATTILKV